MTVIDFAADLLRPGESAIVVHTEGHDLTINRDGSGSTGNWDVDGNKQLDRVIIYHRVMRNGLSNDLFTGEFLGFDGPNEQGRYLIRLKNVMFAGTTDRNWHEFAETGANPVRYIEKPAGS